MGLEGYIYGGSPSDSLLYSDVDVQAVEVSAAKNDVGGYFFLSYRRVETLGLQPGDGAEDRSNGEMDTTWSRFHTNRVELP